MCLIISGKTDPGGSHLRVNGVEMVRFASSPVGGYLSRGMARVGVRTSCAPGGMTSLFSSVIHRKRLLLLSKTKSSSSFFLEVEALSEEPGKKKRKLLRKRRRREEEEEVFMILGQR